MVLFCIDIKQNPLKDVNKLALYLNKSKVVVLNKNYAKHKKTKSLFE